MIVEDPEEVRDLARTLVLVRMAGLLEDGIDLVLERRIVVEAVLGRAQLQRASVADRQDGQAHVLGNRDIARIDGERRKVIDALRVRGAAARPVRDLLQLDAERFAYLLHGGIGFGCSPLEDTAREKCKFHRLLLLFLCRLDEGERVEEVLLVQRVLVALRDARAAKDAAGVLLVFVEVGWRLAAAIFGAELVLRMDDGLDFLDARILRVPVDDEVADDALPSGSIISVSVW